MYPLPFFKSLLMEDPAKREKQWFKLYHSVTGDDDRSKFGQARQWLYFLEEQYKPRHYHNLDHIGYMRELFNIECRDLAEDPDALEWAIWFHDVIQYTRPPISDLNEELSGQIAGRDPALRASFVWKVQTLIRSTNHKGSFLLSDCSLIRDLDLATLGTVEMAYDVYESRVRKEYDWVPEEIWRVKRAKVLQGFLDRKRIYLTDFWRDQRERQARENLQLAIERLKS